MIVQWEKNSGTAECVKQTDGVYFSQESTSLNMRYHPIRSALLRAVLGFRLLAFALRSISLKCVLCEKGKSRRKRIKNLQTPKKSQEKRRKQRGLKGFPDTLLTGS